MNLSRRRLLQLGGAAALGGLGLLEYRSFQGDFDFRRSPGPTAADRYAASLAALEKDPALAAAAVVHIGHSTHLISLGDRRAITDPWFYDPAYGALSHQAGPAVAPERVGRLDLVLITHEHPDHADPRALDRLDKRALAVVATPELKARLRAQGFTQAEVLRPWESLRHRDLEVTAVPAVHDIYEVSYVLRRPATPAAPAPTPTVLFAGDTRLHKDLPLIRERFAPGVAILPVDGTRLRGQPLLVMTPEHAVQAAQILGVKVALPTHGEARFSDPIAGHLLATSIPEAPATFAALMRRQLPAVKCLVPGPGETVPLT